MDRADRCRRAAHDVVADVEPPHLHDIIADTLDGASMVPGVFTLESAAAVDPNGSADVETKTGTDSEPKTNPYSAANTKPRSTAGDGKTDPDTDPDTASAAEVPTNPVTNTDDSMDSDMLAQRAAGVQLIYDGLRLTRSLAHDEPWNAHTNASPDGGNATIDPACHSESGFESRGTEPGGPTVGTNAESASEQSRPEPEQEPEPERESEPGSHSKPETHSKPEPEPDAPAPDHTTEEPDVSDDADSNPSVTMDFSDPDRETEPATTNGGEPAVTNGGSSATTNGGTRTADSITTTRTGDLEILAADILVARGFYVLARTDAADKAVQTVRNFGHDQTVRDDREADADVLDTNLERDVLELAALTGTTAVDANRQSAPATLLSVASTIAGKFGPNFPPLEECLSPADGLLSDHLPEDDQPVDHATSATDS